MDELPIIAQSSPIRTSSVSITYPGGFPEALRSPELSALHSGVCFQGCFMAWDSDY